MNTGRRVPRRMDIPFTVGVIIGLLGLMLSSQVVAAAADSDQTVTVVRDMTKEADCTLEINSTPVVCPAGTVVGDFQVTRAEAEANREAYVVRAGDPVAYHAEVARLTKALREQIKSKQAAGVASPVSNAGVCGGVNYASGSYTAFNFPSPRPRIGYEVRYYLTPNCGAVEIQFVDTYFAVAGSAAHILEMKYDGVPLPLGGDCLDIPNGSNMFGWGGTANREFEHFVRNQCGVFYSTASGSVTLN